jgi:hypothetical protein
MAEIRAQHDTSARKCDTLARLYAQQWKKQKQLLAAGFKNVRINKPQYPATSNKQHFFCCLGVFVVNKEKS